MEKYWNDRMAATQPAPSAVVAAAPPAHGKRSNDTTSNCDDVMTEFDQHRRKLASQARNNGDSGWEAELRRYLKDVPSEVTKDTDIVGWWGVCYFSLIATLV
jgi:hypothetical protein